MKLKQHIPNAITCCNLFCGCLAILFAFENNLILSGYLVGLAAIFDFFDGFAARLLRVTSAIGKDLDSLADMVTFGLLPGVVMYKLLSNSITNYNLVHESLIPIELGVSAFIITIFSAIRLAKFNNDTLNVLNKRLGVNTDSPEKALSVWDEEVSVVIGKHKLNQAYIGTNREQGIAIGVNREPQLEISAEGLTTVKKLRVGLHRISHETQVPGWSGNKGDIVFNANLGPDRVFAWVCLGAHRWQTLKSAE
jgi:hypothetical protein